jgi:DNA-3-methyladenine glycosylase
VRLGRCFYARDALEVAPDLLGKVLVVGACAGRIVETEAYRGDDPASHSFRGPTARNASMFRRGGTLYVYFTYGMHFCANVVTGRAGDGQAVLLRAVAPLRGLDLMRERRGARRDRELANGPGKLCQAMAIDRTFDGVDLCHHADVCIVDDGWRPEPSSVVITPRIGITRGVEHSWRWLLSASAG